MVKEWKIREAEKIREMLEKNELIAVIDMERMPTREFKEIKKKLMDDFEFKFVKKSLLLKALEKSDREGIEKIKEILPNQIMLAFGKGDPFLAFKKLMSIETFRFGREGDIAEDDIIIPAGPTKIPAGPAISDFAKAKIPAGVEKGRIAVKKDTLVVKKGQPIPESLVSLLRKLEIRPIRVRLNVVGIFVNGKLYKRDVLDLIYKYLDMMKEAYRKALSLTINVGYPTKENIKYLLAKAYNQAKYLKEKFGG